jgi:hypothetical protein
MKFHLVLIENIVSNDILLTKQGFFEICLNFKIFKHEK